MDHAKKNSEILEHHLGCYGNFDPEDHVRQQRCAINIRCVIERDEIVRTAILENLMDDENLIIKIQ